MTVTCTAAVDIYMLGQTLVVGIVDTVSCLAVDTDLFAGMVKRTLEGILLRPREALTTGLLAGACILASDHDITLAAKFVLVIGAIFHRTF